MDTCLRSGRGTVHPFSFGDGVSTALAALVAQGGRVGLQCERPGLDAWGRKIPWRRAWRPTPVFSPGESHAQRSLEGYSPKGHKESNMTERLTHTYTPLIFFR